MKKHATTHTTERKLKHLSTVLYFKTENIGLQLMIVGFCLMK